MYNDYIMYCIKIVLTTNDYSEILITNWNKMQTLDVVVEAHATAVEYCF